MEPIEILKIIATPLTVIFVGLWLSGAIEKLAYALDAAQTDNYEIALRLTQLIHADGRYKDAKDKTAIENEYLATYKKTLQKAADLDYD